MKKVTLLGATGSIGRQTLAVIRAHRDQFSIYALAFGKNIKMALPLIKEFAPEKVVVQDEETKAKLKPLVTHVKIQVGLSGLIEISTEPKVDLLVNAIIGRVGLEPTLKAIEAGKTIAIANKETLVTAGHLVTHLARQHQVDLLPIDSEHSAIFQSIQGEKHNPIKKIILTASGGSFRDRTREELVHVTIQDALKHPNWSMGKKITIDSATMMNKGLEIIEAHWLFNLDYDKIDVILHKESIIHSMVEFEDKSVLAQMGQSDMKIPIQYALTYPNRLPLTASESLDLTSIGKLHFQKLNFSRFPCLPLAYQAGKHGGTYPTVLNAANEQAVSLFLAERISFLDIEYLIETALSGHDKIDDPDLATIQQIDVETRKKVLEQI
ncbi:1-deoxy-D-xylulose-5-phosphate reductoisomerase [Amphibacillus sp. Q70]|uniref:1-deoxy-D-xylulose-5-phosphate reductoisomerase n=1 Tax=Amphibacillus sp. Q70 TaxID=3453416 RepID=UPI003F82DA46